MLKYMHVKIHILTTKRSGRQCLRNLIPICDLWFVHVLFSLIAPLPVAHECALSCFETYCFPLRECSDKQTRKYMAQALIILPNSIQQ